MKNLLRKIMTNKFIINLCTAIILFINSSLLCGNTENNINDCPNPNAFQEIAFDTIEKGDTPGVWTLIQKNHTYNTPNDWKFSLMIEANDRKNALKKAKLALSGLQKMQGPEKVNEVWVCDYKSKFALSAVAISN